MFVGTPIPQTKLLLHLDGANGSTTFTDDCGHAVDLFGGVQIDTSQSVFGGASALFDNLVNTRLSVSNIYQDLNFGGGDCTFDCWVRSSGASGLANPQSIFDYGDTGVIGGGIVTAQFGTDNSIQVTVNIDTGGGIILGSGPASVNFNTWYHVAVVRKNSFWLLFLNGVLQGTPWQDTLFYYYMNDSFMIGNNDGLFNTFNGWIDEFRFVNGIALWTSNFTVPQGPYQLYKPAVFPIGTSITEATFVNRVMMTGY